jgi:surface protein
MFSECSSLQNVDGLINWNVSNGKYFGNGNLVGGGSMFAECSSLNNLDGLKNWNVSNGTNFNDFLLNVLHYKMLMI